MPTRRAVVRAGLCLSVAAGGGCAALDPGAVHEGLFSWGFEESAFAPCGRDERWWVTTDGELVERYRAVAERAYEPVFARLRGRVSEPGQYGQLGQYPREFEVTRVLAVRPREAGPPDC